MCDDLVTQHFFEFSVNGSTKTPAQIANAHIFTTNPPINRLWMFLPPTLLAADLPEFVQQHLPVKTSGPEPTSWTVSISNKETALTFYKEWKASWFDQLYEMHRPAITLDAASTMEMAACPPGFLIREDPDYLKSREPDHVSEALLASETFLTIVDEQSGEVAGSVMYFVEDDTQRLYIAGIRVEEKYRRRGLAKALMLRAMATEKEGLTVWLTVFAENVGAVRMYFGLGFFINRCVWGTGGEGPGGYRR